MPPKTKQSIECWLFAEDAGLDAPLLRLQVEAMGKHPAFGQPITGGIETGETAEQACCRESWEETGLVVEAEHLVRLQPHFDVQIDARLTIHKTLFIATAGNRQVQLLSEHIGAKWVAFNRVSELLYWPSNRKTRTAVEQYITARQQ